MTVTFEMASPIAYDGEPLHLDGILAHYAVRGGGRTDTSWQPDADYFPRLPLAIVRHGDHRWYRASAWWPDQSDAAVESSSRFFWSKKWDHDNEDLLDTSRAKSVTLTNARHKEYKVPVQLIATREIRFYCVGDYSHVRQLAGRVVALGLKTGQGFGRVAHHRVQFVRDPSRPFLDNTRTVRWSHWDPTTFERDWRLEDGTPARNVPESWWRERTGESSGYTRPAAISPPYWRRRDVPECAGISR